MTKSKDFKFIVGMLILIFAVCLYAFWDHSKNGSSETGTNRTTAPQYSSCSTIGHTLHSPEHDIAQGHQQRRQAQGNS